ncbi:MAG: hypothetical protein AAF511_10330, partial [Pseudomonadota bacterium]
ASRPSDSIKANPSAVLDVKKEKGDGKLAAKTLLRRTGGCCVLDCVRRLTGYSWRRWHSGGS